MSTSIGDKMKKIRIARNLSQQEVAELMNVSRQYISKWESGERNINGDQLIQYAKIMKVTLDYFSDSAPMRTLSQALWQLEDAFNSADIKEADVDKAYHDIMKIYLKSKEQRAAGEKSNISPVAVDEILDVKEE